MSRPPFPCRPFGDGGSIGWVPICRHRHRHKRFNIDSPAWPPPAIFLFVLFCLSCPPPLARVDCCCVAGEEEGTKKEKEASKSNVVQESKQLPTLHPSLHAMQGKPCCPFAPRGHDQLQRSWISGRTVCELAAPSTSIPPSIHPRCTPPPFQGPFHPCP